MTSAEEFLDALNCTINFTTPEGDYEGVLKQVSIPSRMIIVSKIVLLPSKIKLGTLNFMFHEVSSIKILNRPDIPSENEDETSLIYFRSPTEDMFNLDRDSETEYEYTMDEIPKEEEFEMKLLPCFSKLVSTDSQIINSLGNEFNLAIKLISREDIIGVSLEGPKISRNGILTWLCISTPSCTYLFDILALGENSFQNGLKFILENSKIKKIFHDCRLASDCLFHKYNIRLVNVYDTQVANSLIMMQESKDCSLITQVNSLDLCLSHYLQLPDDYLYSPLTFSLDKNSAHYHGLRPLCHSFRGTMIKNVIYLPLLKRELETALSAPLRRATDVYLNVIQNATDCELMIAPPVMDKLPPELLLEGIQIVRYQQHEYIPPIVSSGPPYRKLVNPVKDFVECCRKFQTKHKHKCLPSGNTTSQIANVNKFSFLNTSSKFCEKSIQLSSDVLKKKDISCQKTNNMSSTNEFKDLCVSSPQNNNEPICIKENIMSRMSQDFSLGEETIFKDILFSGNISMQMNQINENEEFFIGPFEKVKEYEHIVDNTYITEHKTSNPKMLKQDINDAVKISFADQNFHLSENEDELNPIGNCLLRPFNQMPYEKELGSAKSSYCELFSSSSAMSLDQEKKLLTFNADCEDFWNEIRKDCAFQPSTHDQKNNTPKIRFVPAGMDKF